MLLAAQSRTDHLESYINKGLLEDRRSVAREAQFEADSATHARSIRETRSCNELSVTELAAVDLLKNPQLPRGDQTLAVPTLVRRLPTPVEKVIGDVSNAQRILVGLEIPSVGSDLK